LLCGASMVPEDERPIDYKLWLLNELWHWKCYHGHKAVMGGSLFEFREGDRSQPYAINIEGLMNCHCTYCVAEIERFISNENSQRYNENYFHKLGYRVTRPRGRGIPLC
jgi:hypothetical protein